jgi:carbon-monoxide dehydrogenase iron sulfur subunit
VNIVLAGGKLRYIMKKVYVNEDWCLGCHLCEFYCAAGAGGREMVEAFSYGNPLPRITVEEGSTVNFAVQCRHCTDEITPSCVRSCITGAMQVKTEGDRRVIFCDESRCVGCYTCILACPYGSILPDEANHVVKKCDLCLSRGQEPACVAGCPNGAIVYEDSILN